MSKKHEQRTRAEILAKRATPIIEVPVQKKTLLPNGQTMYVTQPLHSEKLRAAFDATKHMPHIGAKEQERAKRCYMSATFNANGEPRSAPVMHQLCKVTQEAYLDARQEEYESVF